MSATQQTLAQMIRAKHPGAYDDMDDVTLEKSVLAKYPQYSDLPQTIAQKPGVIDKANEYAGKALSAAGLPTSIANIPEWLQHLTGTHENSEPFWEPIRKAIKDPTQENIVGAVPFVGPASVAMSKDVQKGDYGGAAATLAGTIAGVKGAGQVGPGLSAAKQLVQPTAEAAARRMYQAALKPGPGSYSSAEVKSMVSTGVGHGIPVSPAGVEKLGTLISDLNDSVKAEIQAGTNNGATVNKFTITGRLGATAKQFETQVNPDADLNAVGEAGNEFLRNQPNDIPAMRAQDLKSGTYQQIRKSYGELRSATVESQKSLARGIKEELGKQFPEIKGMNAQEGKFIGLDEALNRAVRRIENRDIFSLGSKIATGSAAVVGSTIAGGPGAGAAAAATAVMHHVLSDPTIQSKIAIGMSRQAKIPFNVARAKVAAYAGALASSAPNSGDQTSQQ